jgi:N-acetylmuramoyl-L-alanine amidase
MPKYIVKQGETLSGIAKKHKLANWEAIYNHPNNAEFKNKRPNPNLIYPGDEIYVPAMQIKSDDGSTEQKHRFEVKRQTQMLRIAVEDITGKRIANEKYKLVVGDQKFEGTTDTDGLLEEMIPVDAQKGKLRVGKERWDLLIGHLNPIEENTLDRGVSGAQGRLKNLGYAVGPVDGIPGPKTKAAIEAFQADEKLTANGQLNDETRKAIVRVHNI